MSSRPFPLVHGRCGQALPPSLTEALDYFNRTAERDDLRVAFMLEPGEMLLWHNFQMPRARTAYQDSPERARRPPRFWLRIKNDRPVAAEILECANVHQRIHRERSGRVPASAQAP